MASESGEPLTRWFRLGTQLAVIGEQLHGGGVEGQAPTLMCLGRLDDLPAAADGVGALDEQVLLGEVDVAPSDGAQFAAARPGDQEQPPPQCEVGPVRLSGF